MNPESKLASDDEALVAGLVRGDQASLAALYDRHAPRLLALGLRMLRDRAEAEDVVHDVYMEAWHRAAGFEARRASVRTWLIVRMRSRCLDRLRAHRVRRDAPEASHPRPTPLSPARSMEAGADGSRLSAAMAHLTAEQREVLELVYFQGLSTREAADRTGTPQGTIKSRMRLAVQHLRLVLDPGVAT